MASYTLKNLLDQALDIAGSFTKNESKVLADEVNGLGQASANTGSTSVTFSAVTSGIQTLSGMTGGAYTAASVGQFLTTTGATNVENRGTFLINEYVSATSVKIANSAGIAEGPTDDVVWTERAPYMAEDDHNFSRTDRKGIKGTTHYYDAVPAYERPSAVGTSVPANLTNIASKTLDAHAKSVGRNFFGATVASTNTKITITSAGNLKHADATDQRGVPCLDTAPFSADYAACFTKIVNPATGNELEVLAGAHEGERIIGMTNKGASTSPNTVEIIFYSVDVGAEIVVGNLTAYTWEAAQPTSINLNFGYNKRLDELGQNDLRLVEALGVVTDADVRQDVNDIQTVIGMDDEDVSLNGKLTNLTNYFPFSDLPDATPSVVEALNTLNEQIGDRTYTSALLTDGETVTASIEALGNAISAASGVRTIERLAADVPAGTSHVLPGSISYTLDGTGNGRNMFVLIEGLMGHPGAVVNGNNYVETDTTHVTFHRKVKSGDIIDYIIYQ